MLSLSYDEKNEDLVRDALNYMLRDGHISGYGTDPRYPGIVTVATDLNLEEIQDKIDEIKSSSVKRKIKDSPWRG